MSSPEHAITATGGCLCGAVRFTVRGPLGQVLACHCSQCRRQTGNFVVATRAARADVTIDGAEAVTWYGSSPEAKRGFCRHCGSALFWQPLVTRETRNEHLLSIMAGALDTPTGLTLDEHIHVADCPDWYRPTDSLPKRPAGRTSPLLPSEEL